MFQPKVISADGREPCIQCQQLVHVSHAVLVRELARGETPLLQSRPDPYAPSVAICCSQECADLVIDGVLRKEAHITSTDLVECPECGNLLEELQGANSQGDIYLRYWRCSLCGYTDGPGSELEA